MAETPQPPSESAGARFDQLVDIMRTLRSPDGCPWDREQTLSSLRPFLLEEAYEVLDAIDRGDTAALRDELGDLVFEAVFLAQLCAENDQFTIADALASVTNKLIRRHPHVFGDGDERGSVTTAEDVKRRWEEIKADERAEAGHPPSLLGSIPVTLPALLRAYRIGKRAATVGFDWRRPEDVMKKVDEEFGELREAVEDGVTAKIEEEMGDVLLAMANLARHVGVEPEAALGRATRKFSQRFAALEQHFQERRVPLRDVPMDDMEREWARIKQTADR